jgi:hypothetical protein
MTLRSRGRSFRYAAALARLAGQSAQVVVAFALTAGIPAKRSDGKTMKLPPPATALSAPPSAPAPKRSAARTREPPVTGRMLLP